MTNRGSDVAITISARDRASPVMAKVSKNVTKMQGSVVSMTSSMGALSSATSGVLGPMGSMVGSFGLAGLAVTGLSVALSLGIKRFKEMREEQKKTSQATTNLRTRLMLSGFSADRATSSVDELRSGLSRLAFQALPTLDFEMQGFIANMDKGAKTRFGDMVETVTKGLFGLEPTLQQTAAASSAVGEAFRGNFTPIAKLLTKPIGSFEDFTNAVAELKVAMVSDSSDIVLALKRMVDGSISVQDGTKELRNAIEFNLPAAAKTFIEEGDSIRFLLRKLATDEGDYVREHALDWNALKAKTKELPATHRNAVAIIRQQLLMATIHGRTYSKEVETETGRRIEQVERVAPVVAQEFQKLADEYKGDAGALLVLNGQIAGFVNSAIGQWGDWRTAVEQNGSAIRRDLQAVADEARRTLAALRAARMTATPEARRTARIDPSQESGGFLAGVERGRIPVPTATPRRVGRPSNVIPHGLGLLSFGTGAIVTRPTIAQVGEVPEIIAPLTALPGLGLGGGAKTLHITIQIGEHRFAEAVINVLNDEITLREPSLGLS